MATALILVTRPFSLCKLAIMISLKIMLIVIRTWVELLVATINFHLNMFRKTMICFIGLVLFPVRVLNALPREKMLEDHLLQMQIELDNLIWEKKELHSHLQIAVKERRILESMFAEVEEENDKTIAKIELLEVEVTTLSSGKFIVAVAILKDRQPGRVPFFPDLPSQFENSNLALLTSLEVERIVKISLDMPKVLCLPVFCTNEKMCGFQQLQDLKAENAQLKENLVKGRWSFKDHDHRDNGRNIIADNYSISSGIQSWKSDYKGTGTLIQDLMMQKDGWEGNSKSKAEFVSTDSVPVHQVTAGIFSRNLDTIEALEHRRDAALSQSLFSAVLSLLVGMIIWEAEDPCMPLVVALFTVVGMSLKSVVQFFSTVKNKPASDAVALLSINWFILGTLTYPTLPRVAHMLAPWALSFLDRTVSWLGISSR
ncbi:unnamed protein product [Dovyalis caffra]|uniref:Uncharacterized protein n=1 Tax=Dovyalis caffra TaxID=77055 RepID=A0AAV1ST91_9ROSI|nr:unnamed protein product [Dovyalis caffra]